MLAAQREGILKTAVGYADQQAEIPSAQIKSLRFAPVRALSFLPSQKYYAAKKWYADRTAARLVHSGRYDLLHSWSGDCLYALIAARQKDVRSVIDIPTWHRNKGRKKPFITKSERERRALTGADAIRAMFRISRQRVIAEYELADRILVPSRCAEETFLQAGFSPKKLVYVARGVDPEHYTPATTPPDRFRLVFTGALIERKGVHHLLDAWEKLALPAKAAELVLLGQPHGEIKKRLARRKPPGVVVPGFISDVGSVLRSATAFVFPSECEGFAKATLEAAATGLPLIATRESGDAIVDGKTGHLIPPNDPAALADAILDFYHDPARAAAMGRAARQHVLDHFTWDHYRTRILGAYRQLA
jgi:glycosyltransferase involved in cell wall biosynthesis